LKVGQGRLDIAIHRRGNETLIESVNAVGVEVSQVAVEAPLGGKPVGAFA